MMMTIFHTMLGRVACGRRVVGLIVLLVSGTVGAGQSGDERKLLREKLNDAQQAESLMESIEARIDRLNASPRRQIKATRKRLESSLNAYAKLWKRLKEKHDDPMNVLLKEASSRAGGTLAEIKNLGNKGHRGLSEERRSVLRGYKREFQGVRTRLVLVIKDVKARLDASP